MTPESLRLAKKQLRRTVVDRVLAMDPAERHRQGSELEARFPTLPGFDQAEAVLLFVSHLPEEFETRGMIRLALDRGKQVVCPRVDRAERRLVLCRIDDPEADFVPGPFGIPEPAPGRDVIPPERIDWALVPGIAFDRLGFRLGRGAGFYDRLLPTLSPGVPRLSLVLDPQWVDELPTEPHDQPVDGVVGVDRSCFPGSRPGRGIS